MYIINTTYHIDMRLLRAFSSFVKDEGVKAVNSCSFVGNGTLCQVLGGDDPNGISLAWQQHTDSLVEAHRWSDGDLATLHSKMHELWGDKVLHFTTFLKTLD